MNYNTILVQLDLDAPAAPRLNFAIDVARLFEADLIAFAAGEAPPAALGEGSGIAAATAHRRRVDHVDARLAALKEEFLDIAGDREHLSWHGAVGDPTQLLAVHARAADLLITGTAAGGASRSPYETVDAGALVLSAGRPVLVAGADLTPLRAEKIVVAWTDAREARRAVADAVPFLKQAKEVVVATVESFRKDDARRSAAEVVRHLMRHGAQARAEVLGKGRSGVEKAITDLARDSGADLIVAGGYGHSRLREWAFGGMTRSLLADGSLHRLISN